MLAGANVRPVITNKETEVEIAEDPDDKPPFLDRQVLLLTVNDNTLYSKARFKLRADPEEGLDYYYLAERSQFGCLFVVVVVFSSARFESRFCSVPQWGAADAEIKVPSSENTELKRSPFKAWSRSVYSHACYAYCQGFLSCLFLHFQSIHLHFFQNLSRFFPVLAVANTWFLCRPAE